MEGTSSPLVEDLEVSPVVDCMCIQTVAAVVVWRADHTCIQVAVVIVVATAILRVEADTNIHFAVAVAVA